MKRVPSAPVQTTPSGHGKEGLAVAGARALRSRVRRGFRWDPHTPWRECADPGRSLARPGRTGAPGCAPGRWACGAGAPR